MDKKADNEKNGGNTFLKKIGKTVYKVTIHFSNTNNETVQDKIKRLIMRDIEDGKY